jgi:TP901 family phage tail tape measure protein
MLGTLSVQLDAQTAKFTQGLRQAMGSLRGFSETASTHLVGIGTAFAGLGLASKKAVSTFAAFESGMVRAGAIAGASSEQIKEMEKVALDLAKSTKYTGTEVTEAYQFMSMAGMKAKEQIEAIGPVLHLAAAGNIELGQSADVVTSILKGFGKQTGDLPRVADIMTAAITNTKVTVDSLGEAFKQAGPAASAAGIGFEEAVAAIGMMGDAGIEASMAGNSLKVALINMVRPGKDASDAIARLKLNLTKDDGSLRSFGEILRELERAQIDLGDAASLFGNKAAAPMLALAKQGSARFEELNRIFGKSKDLAKSLSDTFMDTLTGSLNAMGASVEEATVALGRGMSPVVRALAGVVGTLAGAFSALPSIVQGVVGVGLTGTTMFAGLATAIGGALRVVPILQDGFRALNLDLGKTLRAIVGMPAAMTKSMTTMALMKIGVKSLALALGKLTAGLAIFTATATAVAGAARMWGTIAGGGRQAFTERYGDPKEEGIWTVFSKVMTDGGDAVGEAFSAVSDTLDGTGADLDDAGAKASAGADALADGIEKAAKAFEGIDFGGEAAAGVLDDTASALADAYDEISALASGGIDWGAGADLGLEDLITEGDTFSGIQEAFGALSASMAVDAENYARDAAAIDQQRQQMFSSLSNFASAIGTRLAGEVGGQVATTLASGLQRAAPMIAQTAQAALQGFAAGGPMGAVAGALATLFTKLQFFSDILGQGEGALGRVLSSVDRAFSNFKDLFMNITAAVDPIVQILLQFAGVVMQLDFATALVAGAIGMVADAVAGVVEWIVAGWNSLIEKLANMLGKVSGRLANYARRLQISVNDVLEEETVEPSGAASDLTKSMEDLDDATKAATGGMVNVPEWFKTNLERFRAADVEPFGGAGGAGAPTPARAAAGGAAYAVASNGAGGSMITNIEHISIAGGPGMADRMFDEIAATSEISSGNQHTARPTAPRGRRGRRGD